MELARAFGEPGRAVWLQEIGAPGNVLADDEILPFARGALAHAADSPSLWGVTWWCSHDVDPSLADAFVPKPFRREELLSAVDEALAG